MKKIHYRLPKLVHYQKAILIFLILINCTTVFAQSVQRLNRDMESIAKPTSKPGWIKFKNGVNINPITLFNDYRAMFELSMDDEMRLQKSNSDKETGQVDYIFKQYYKGIKIDAAQYSVHQNSDGTVYSANGKIAKGLSLRVNPDITEEQALHNLFKNHVAETSGAWLDPKRESELKAQNENTAATNYPKGELLIHRRDFSKGLEIENLLLVWKFEVRVIPGANSKVYYIDASNGNLINTTSMAKMCSSGNITTVHNGSRTIYTKNQLIGSDYELTDNCSSHSGYSIHTKNAEFMPSSFSSASEFTSSNTDWNANNTEKSGANVHWCIEKAEKYYREVRSRDSYDDGNANIEVLANYNHGNDMGNGDNGCWNCESQKITIGYGTDQNILDDDLATLDIVGHEFTHAVIEYTAGLDGGEADALNESIADCLGEAIEKYVTGSTDWIHGGERGNGRNFASPRTYLGDYWDFGVDSGLFSTLPDPHTNGRTNDYWFYLLSVGGSGVNDNGEYYNVSGIGIENAADIVYRALVSGDMNPGTQYPDYREATIEAANYLFGSCSNEAIQVGKAWNAVGVGSTLDAYDTELCGNLPFSILGIPIPLYKGINSVVSPGSSCSIATVDLASGSVTFAGGNFVELNEGFLVSDYGSNSFTAMTDECSFTYHFKNGNTLNDNEEEQGQIEKQNEGLKLNCFPNPFSSIINLKCTPNSTGELKIEVMDLQGKIIKSMSQEISEQGIAIEIPLNLEDMPAGFYFLRVSDGIKSSVQKIIKS